MAGTNKLYEGGSFHEVENIFAHHQYENFTNDIAVIKILGRFNLNNYTQPIQINRHLILPTSEIQMSGWGRVGTEKDISYDLKFTTAHYISEKECQTSTGLIHPGIMCLEASSVEGVCFGDSGSPATLNNKLIGVANFIVDGCGTIKPDGFASVSYFYNWIVDHMRL